MLYLGIDEHGKQLTVCLRDEEGRVVLRRQVSTLPEKVRPFFEGLRESSREHGGFAAIVEVCGFNDWLLEMLSEYGCQHTVLIHPDKRSRRKTDRRDANMLCEALWLNRQRLAAGGRLQGLRRIVVPSAEDQQARELTAQRQRVAQRRTRTINQIKNVLRRYNLIWDCPTKGIQTLTALRWLGELRDDTHSPLNEVDRLNLSHLLEQWEMWSRELGQLEALIAQRALRDERVKLLRTVPGISEYSGLALACRVSSVERFPHPRSLANYFGLTPGCRNSGEATDRLGSITKEGSRIARFILAQVVLHVLKRDSAMRGWYARIKHRRGSKIARVAVMRRLATIVWHLLKHQEAYQVGGIRRRHPRKAAVEESASRSKKALLGTRQKGGRPVPSSPSIRPEG